jgi:demethylmenaquinone methyltransferase/2-methoxy-6-polyprenyl-1,4-benzoquinol methylase
MFGRIAHRYDLANRVLSGGIDIYWRAHLVKAVRNVSPNTVLDLATGSGDVAFALARILPASARILGVDFCEPMIAEASAKKAGRGPNVEFQVGDALALPFPGGAFDAATIAFGYRNMADRPLCLAEIRRVLRPGGSIFILEFSQPRRWLRPFYGLYLRRVLPRVAGVLTGDRSAYDYLCGSINAFPEHTGISSELAAAGFRDVGVERLTGGIVALHRARAP